MIPLDLWNSDDMKRRRENAVAKALREKPKVEDAGGGGGADLVDKTTVSLRLYRVGDKYTVQTYKDADDQYFIECNCLAGSPPLDENTGLPSREAVPCYHAASVLIHIAEQEKE